MAEVELTETSAFVPTAVLPSGKAAVARSVPPQLYLRSLNRPRLKS
jgi:hypothetical protein